MCGRYVAPDIRAIEREWELLHRSGGLDGWQDGIYNAAPTTQLPVVRMEDGKAFVQAMRWASFRSSGNLKTSCPCTP